MFKEQYQVWLEKVQDPELSAEIKGLTDDEDIKDRFYKDLEFGTAGLRGKLGVGTNRMNVYTVGKATQGLAQYLLNHFEKPSLVIAYDSRIKSDVFAELSASILAANGVKVYLFESLRPTPMLSFAVRHLGTDSGIVITASHNPTIYNGYKVYGSDGGQITDETATETFNEISKVDAFTGVKHMSFEDGKASGLIEIIGEDVDKVYYEKVKQLVVRPELVKEKAGELKIIYTPIHGTGNIPIRRVLSELGFTQVEIVKEQELPDGNFPTAPYPNPEVPQVFELALKLAETVNPDIIMGTDPDADRISAVVKGDDGYQILTGNQMGMLLTEYILSARKDLGQLQPTDAIIKTIVTSDLCKHICDGYGVQMMEVLTGFKYIAEIVQNFQETNSNKFLLGFEESYGYLSGEFVRDKDAVIAATLIAEMALYYKTQGKTLYDALQDIYSKYIYTVEDVIAVEMDGASGQEKMKELIDSLRNNPPTQLGNEQISVVEDYGTSTRRNLETKEEETINLPKSNVIKFKFKDGGWFVVRPSGTEPKIKLYFYIEGNNKEQAQANLAAIKSEVQNKLFAN